MTNNANNHHEQVVTGACATHTTDADSVATTAQRNTFFNSNVNEPKLSCKTANCTHSIASEQTLSQPAAAGSHSDLANSATTSDDRYLTTEQLVIRISFFHTQFTINIKHI